MCIIRHVAFCARLSVRRFSCLFAPLAFLAIAACNPTDESNSASSPSVEVDNVAVPIGAGFDFYVLALSWSPGYCASEGPNADKNQCDGPRPYEFVVHGLWPQFEKGYPSDCDSEFPSQLPNTTINGMLDIMPSYGLIKHEWRKHGRCSGLSADDYFTATRIAFEKIKSPPSFNGLQETMSVSPASVEKLFQAENSAIPGDGIAVTCKRKYLRDVRICMTKDLASFRSCPEVDRNSCRSQSVAVAPTR